MSPISLTGIASSMDMVMGVGRPFLTVTLKLRRSLAMERDQPLSLASLRVTLRSTLMRSSAPKPSRSVSPRVASGMSVWPA